MLCLCKKYFFFVWSKILKTVVSCFVENEMTNSIHVCDWIIESMARHVKSLKTFLLVAVVIFLEYY